MVGDEMYHECDCDDAVKDREINDKIDTLNTQRPKKKYKIEEVRMLSKLNQ